MAINFILSLCSSVYSGKSWTFRENSLNTWLEILSIVVALTVHSLLILPNQSNIVHYRTKFKNKCTIYTPSGGLFLTCRRRKRKKVRDNVVIYTPISEQSMVVLFLKLHRLTQYLFPTWKFGASRPAQKWGGDMKKCCKLYICLLYVLYHAPMIFTCVEVLSCLFVKRGLHMWNMNRLDKKHAAGWTKTNMVDTR